jgi:hypothetical protein
MSGAARCCADGLIVEVGDGRRAARRPSQAEVIDHGDALILPGFIDAHAHYPQTAIIASWGKRLIDWLNTYTFPEEMRFSAIRPMRRGSRRATSTFCWPMAPQRSAATARSIPKASRRSSPRRRRAACGCWRARPAWTATPRPRGLRDTAQSAYDDSKALLERWHGVDRLSYVITPRFSPTSTEAQLDALGALWAEHPDCLMQTHLSEQTDEIAWVKSLYPRRATTSTPTRRTGFWGRTASTATPSTSSRARSTGWPRSARPSSIARPRTPSSARACSTWVSGPDARGAGHRYRRRLVLLDAAHDGRGLRDRPTPGHRAAPVRAAVAGHRRLGRRAAASATGSGGSRRASRPTWWCSTSPPPRPSPRPMHGPRTSGRRSFTRS